MATSRRQQLQTKLQEKRDKLDEARRKRKVLLTQTFNSLFNNAEGKFFLRWLMDQCGYQKISCVLNAAQNEISPIATVHDDARRSIYLELRKYIKPEVLYHVELDPPQENKEE